MDSDDRPGVAEGSVWLCAAEFGRERFEESRAGIVFYRQLRGRDHLWPGKRWGVLWAFDQERGRAAARVPGGRGGGAVHTKSGGARERAEEDRRGGVTNPQRHG